MLSINIVELGINVVTFLVALVILSKIFYKPLITTLESRKNRIEQAIADAEKNKSEMTTLKAEYEQKMEEVRKKVDDLIKDAIKSGQKDREDIINEAREEAKKIMTQTQNRISDEKEKMLKELREEVVRLSIMSAEKIIKDTINKKTQKKIVNNFLDKLEKVSKN